MLAVGDSILTITRAGMPVVRAVKVADVRKEFDLRYVVDEADPREGQGRQAQRFRARA